MNHCNAHLAQGYFLHHYIHVAINDGEEEQDVFFVIFNLSKDQHIGNYFGQGKGVK